METTDLDHEEMSRIFESNKESVQLLYLTQSSSTKYLDINQDYTKGNREASILVGHPTPRLKFHDFCPKEPLPGALSALVLGETLFHHAEPSQNFKTCPALNWNKSFVGLIVHGGNNSYPILIYSEQS